MRAGRERPREEELREDAQDVRDEAAQGGAAKRRTRTRRVREDVYRAREDAYRARELYGHVKRAIKYIPLDPQIGATTA